MNGKRATGWAWEVRKQSKCKRIHRFLAGLEKQRESARLTQTSARVLTLGSGGSKKTQAGTPRKALSHGYAAGCSADVKEKLTSGWDHPNSRDREGLSGEERKVGAPNPAGTLVKEVGGRVIHNEGPGCQASLRTPQGYIQGPGDTSKLFPEGLQSELEKTSGLQGDRDPSPHSQISTLTPHALSLPHKQTQSPRFF